MSRILAPVLACLLLPAGASTGSAAELVGFASLPATTFVEGPTSGIFLPADAWFPAPFTGRQPVQGFSALLPRGDGTYLALVDNGFGARDNSADFLLAVYVLTPEFRTAEGGPGTIRAELAFRLRDPDRQLGIPILADSLFLPGTDIPLDPRVRDRRVLTGWDLDPESFRRAPDGTFWFGDEFGPFLVHTDSTGRVLEPVIPLPDVRAPENPLLALNERPRAMSSGGYEGLAASPDGDTLHAMIEAPLLDDPETYLRIYRFDRVGKRWLEPMPWRIYPLDRPGYRAGAFTAVSEDRFLVVERDGGQGPEARFKKVFLVDANVTDDGVVMRKREVCDLLAIEDPHDLGGLGSVFTFPFVTIESVALVDERTIAVANDNNFPFSVGRHLESGAPDDTELILVRLPEAPARMAMEP